MLILGIHSAVHRTQAKCNGKIFNVWRLDVPYSHDRRRFFKLIHVPTKQQAFEVAGYQSGETNSSDDLVPLELIRDHCYDRARAIGKPFGKRVGDERPYSNMRPRYNATRPKLRRLAEFLDDDPLLLKYADSDVYWGTVVSNEPQ